MSAILVTHASGELGQAIIHNLLSQDSDVRVRAAVHPDAALTIDDNRVEVVQLQYDDPTSVATALAGIDKVLWQTPITPLAYIYTQRFLEAARSANVQHIVLISSYGARMDAANDIARQHAQNETLLVTSGIAYTVLRPTVYAQQLAGLWPWLYEPQSDTFYSPAPAGKIAWLDVRNVAQAASYALLHPETQLKSYTLTGPAAMSLQDAVAKISQVVDRPLNVVAMDKQDYLERMRDFGAGEYLIDSLTTVYDAIDANEWATVTDELPNLLNDAPISFEQFVADYIDTWQCPSVN